jgi:peptidoglycan L-alanyl-D-glutamate endopeptidase CwlK
MENVVLHYDCTIIEGHRDMVTQNSYYNQGRSKVRWPDGKHNKSPSQAVDAAPYISGRGIPWPKAPTDWNDSGQRNTYIKDTNQFYHFAGFVIGMAETLDIPIRWGGDWDMDNDFRDNKFDDLVHFELHL